MEISFGSGDNTSTFDEYVHSFCSDFVFIFDAGGDGGGSGDYYSHDDWLLLCRKKVC